MNAATSPPIGYDDNPEWTDDDFALARPADEVLPAAAVAALVRNRGGRPAGSTKEQVSLRLDKDMLARWRAEGPGWQSRMNDVLRRHGDAGHGLMAAARGQGDGASRRALTA